jgi:hypothetical protein
MMSSPSAAQSEAARRNGAQSHGPVTPEGKARSSQNAVTHGLSAKRAIVHPDDVEVYEQFVAGLLESLKPQDALENMFFEQIVRAAWNLRRFAALEAQLFEQAGHIDPLLSDDPAIQKKAATLYRHRADNQRSYNRALKDLKFSQNNRLTREQFPKLLPPEMPALADATAFAKQTRQALRGQLNSMQSELEEETKNFQTQFQDLLKSFNTSTE